MPSTSNTSPITPAGLAALRARYDHLLGTERPEIVEIVSWAAGNGDRSENGDYLYGRKRMREIDRELGYLAKVMKHAQVVDPVRQPDKTRIFFGATVTIADEDDLQRTVTIVGDKEQDAGTGRIGWSSPIARALRGAGVGDLRTVRLPAGQKGWEVLAIAYPDEDSVTARGADD
ncbi:GreA/GreB family elongation factor [Aurantiacibacter spongiae]|uniref:Transcription elongation factor GreB n=1 Tax=Aurantiacibacter spongiae TaxID=2488860 RepID=A0A3N5CPZ5_9SPHN|nr:GreA/GreB family elongation factor [Aurantiacibacter spongiae]RPF70667.1 transcription elongation factor GreB [Aurantiacibacter spongiae]